FLCLRNKTFPFTFEGFCHCGDGPAGLLYQRLVTFQNSSLGEVFDLCTVRALRPWTLQPLAEVFDGTLRRKRTARLYIGWASHERTDLHLQHVTRPLFHKCGQQIGIHMTLNDWTAFQRDLRCRHRTPQEGYGIAKGFPIERPVLAEGEGERDGLTAAAGTTDTLAIVRDGRRYVRHHNG